MSERASPPSRRQLLAGAGAALGAAVVSPLSSRSATAQADQPAQPARPPQPGAAAAPATRPANEPFGYCLNTSTINGSNVPLPEQFEIAARAGFTAVEPWLRDIEAFAKKGGSIDDLAKRIRDLGMAIPSAIGFARWIVDDDAERAKGLEQMKRDMDVVARLGGTHIAAPPIGANDASAPLLDLNKVAARYRAVLELGEQTGVIPEVEVWGPSKNLSKMSEAAYVAVGAGHPKACILGDVYHMYKGGSAADGLLALSGQSMHCMHLNDYPAQPPRDTITDAHRIYPGDGVAPLDTIFRHLRAIGYRGYLSLELFNRDYWKTNPQKIAQTGFDKLRAAVQKAFA